MNKRKSRWTGTIWDGLDTASFWALMICLLIIPGLIFGPFWGWLHDRLGGEGLGGLVVVVQIALIAGPKDAIEILLLRTGFFEDKK